MSLSTFSFDQMLPPYLTKTDKARVKTALEQFFNKEDRINYNGFYLEEVIPHLLQADVLPKVLSIVWDSSEGRYNTGYGPAMLISNSCDVSPTNERGINTKNALFAPVIPVKIYLEIADKRGFSSEKIEGFRATLIRQEHTNLFYLPKNNPTGDDYIVNFDQIYWVPKSELQELQTDILKSRSFSLSDWAYYLFLTKLSLHTCRVPEEIERRLN